MSGTQKVCSSTIRCCQDTRIRSGLGQVYIIMCLCCICMDSSHNRQIGAEIDAISRMNCMREILTSHRQALPRFPLRLQCREPRSLPPRTRQGSCCPGLKTHAELSRILQRCLPSLRREGHLHVGFRDGPAYEHWC